MKPESEPSSSQQLRSFVQAQACPQCFLTGRLEGNGKRDVLIYRPPGLDKGSPISLVYHFHGTYAEKLEPPSSARKKKYWVGWKRLEQTLAAIDELQASKQDNVILIYPFSAGRRYEANYAKPHKPAYDRKWMLYERGDRSSDSFTRLHQAVQSMLSQELSLAKPFSPGRVIVEAHSAGGIALLNIAKEGSPNIDDYLFLDASFQDWADGCYAALLASGSRARVTMVIREAGIADPLFGPNPWCTTLEEDASRWRQRGAPCQRHAEKRAHSKHEEENTRQEECHSLEKNAQAWKKYAQWCAEMKLEMQGQAQVELYWTKIYHGKQTRHFAGGLNLLPYGWKSSLASN